MELLVITFWVSFFIVFWTYFGYLITLKLLSLFINREVDKSGPPPPVTVIVTAYNEEKRIGEKIENSLALDYPEGKLNILIVSDGSSDGTDDIVKRYVEKGVRLLRIPERHGKHFGQKHGIDLADTEIVVLTDATTFLKEDAVLKIVRSFSDPSIGVVSGEDKVSQDDANSSGEGAYVAYEMKLRSLEAQVGSLVGASGSFFAIRKSLAKTWVENMSSDFFMPIVAYKNGYRTVPDSEAIGYYTVLANPDREFDRKVRTVLHGLEVLFRFKDILNPFKYGFYSFQMISHKLMRWLAPLALLAILFTSATLFTTSLFFQIVLASQLLFYALALIGRMFRVLQGLIVFKVPVFFVMVNISILMAWINYFTGKRQVVWEATKR